MNEHPWATTPKPVIAVNPSLGPAIQDIVRAAVEKNIAPSLGILDSGTMGAAMCVGLMSGMFAPEVASSLPGSIGSFVLISMAGSQIVRLSIPKNIRSIKLNRAARAAYNAKEWRTSAIGWDKGESLIRRADDSINWVTGSLVHKNGQIDTVHNEMVLPRQLWDLMCDITELQEHRANRPSEASPLAQAHDNIIKQIQVNCERRVQALETYAREVMNADKRYAELVSVERLESKSSSLLDLLARTSTVDLAVSELAELTDGASQLVESYRTALAAAREAGLALTKAPA